MEKRKYRIRSASTIMYTVKMGVYNSFLHLHLVGATDERDAQECYVPRDRTDDFLAALRASSGEPVADVPDIKGIVAAFDVEGGKAVSITTDEGTIEFEEPVLG